ncbi:MAG: GNAT family N-acetyltransferase [Dehalococcoidia bacterium]
MEPVTIIVVQTAEEMAEALRIRMRVFVEEQGVWPDIEVDAYDRDPAHDGRVVHILARLDGTPVGTARLLLDAATATEDGARLAKIGRVAVLAEHRRRHVGKALMAALHEEARRRGFGGIAISAQLQAVPFYERLGYVGDGPVYLEDGIDHRAMTLRFAVAPGDA